MSAMIALAPCFICRLPFGFNPSTVPSHQGRPVCRSCMNLVNAERHKSGRPPHPIPANAYQAEEEE